MSNIHFYSSAARLARVVSFASRARLDSRWCTRGLHQRRALLYKLEDGLGEFLPPPALKSIAVDWQQGLLERLNEEVRGTSQAVFCSVLLVNNN
jgi:Fe-Mn family superoxide dismutase